MASSLSPTSIDATFPVAGQDNDSQGFRDNFTINVSDTQIYRQAGNSIVVDILIALLKQIDITRFGR